MTRLLLQIKHNLVHGLDEFDFFDSCEFTDLLSLDVEPRAGELTLQKESKSKIESILEQRAMSKDEFLSFFNEARGEEDESAAEDSEDRTPRKQDLFFEKAAYFEVPQSDALARLLF